MGETARDTALQEPTLGISTEVTRRPAICIAAADLELDAVARTLLRANREGYYVFVLVSDSTDPEIESLVRELTGGVLEVEPFEREPPCQFAETVARSFGFPGLLYLDAPDQCINFAKCEAVAESAPDFATHAPTAGVDVPESPAVIAGIPAYNEEATIGDVVTEVRPYVDEVVVVDDGSDDETAAVAEQAGATVISHDRNCGYGAALTTTFTEANRRNARRLVILDGDGQHDPDDVPKLLEEMQTSGANVVIGSRFGDDSELRVPLYRRFGLLVINVLTNLSLGVVRPRSWVSDTQSGFRAYDRTAMQTLATGDIGDGMGASTDVLYHAHGRDYDIAEVETTIDYDGEKTSTQNPLVHGIKLVGNIVKTVEHERPLTALGIPGLATVAVGAGFGYWTLINYLNSETFPAGLALLCIFCVILGSLLTVTSVILHSLNTHIERLTNLTRRRWH